MDRSGQYMHAFLNLTMLPYKSMHVSGKLFYFTCYSRKNMTVRNRYLSRVKSRAGTIEMTSGGKI